MPGEVRADRDQIVELVVARRVAEVPGARRGRARAPRHRTGRRSRSRSPRGSSPGPPYDRGVSVRSTVSTRLAPLFNEAAPALTGAFVREALHRALHGVGPLPPASVAADRQLREQRGDVDRAIHEVIENHVRYAGAQGLVTNVGGW